MKKIVLTIIFFFTAFSLFAQNGELDYLQKNYKSFNYQTVIELSNTLLTSKDRFSETDLIQIFTLKAASEYLINDLSNSRKSFLEILKIDEFYNLNSIDYSPKIIEFYSDIQNEFKDLREYEATNNNENNQTPINIEATKKISLTRNISSAIGKSLLVPGWGHLSLRNDTKGWLLTTASVATLGSMLYFIFDTNNKEKDYLGSIKSDISKNYDRYNTAYKIRNTLILSYAAIWVYSQIDLLFISTDLGSKNISPGFSKNLPQHKYNPVIFSINIPL